MSTIHPTATPPVRVAVYFRMSSDRQEDSIDRQRSQVMPFVAARGYQVVGEYIDHGIGGDELAKRKAFVRLLRDAAAGKVARIVVDDVDRFGRFDAIDFGEVVAPLRRAGVTLESVANGVVDWQSFAGRVVHLVQTEAKHAEVAATSRRVLTDMVKLVKEGRSVGGKPPYGYRRDSHGRLTVLEDEAKVVRYVFQEVRAGRTLGEVQKALAARAVPAPAGGRLWGRQTLRAVVANRAYVGDAVVGRRAGGKYHAIVGGQVVAKPTRAALSSVGRSEDDWVVVADAHPAVVGRDLFADANARLAGNRRRTTPHVGGGPFVLTRLLACDHCGSLLVGTTERGVAKYVCAGAVNYGTGRCHARRVGEAAMVRLILAKLKARLLCPETIARLEAAAGATEAALPDARSRLAAVVDELNRQIAAGGRRLIAGDLSPEAARAVDDAIRQAAAERDRAIADLRAAETARPVADLRQSVGRLRDLLWRLEEAAGLEDRGPLRRLLAEVVKVVKVRWREDTLPSGRTVGRVCGGTIALVGEGDDDACDPLMGDGDGAEDLSNTANHAGQVSDASGGVFVIEFTADDYDRAAPPVRWGRPRKHRHTDPA